MALFRKSEVIVLKDSDSVLKQIEELESLESQATGALKEEISKQLRCLKRGNTGEDEIMFHLNYSDMDMIVLRDLFIVCDGLQAQIDYYVITPKLHFIIECKNLFGNITINNKGDFIRSYNYNGKYIKEGINSPITQNERHMLVLKNRRIGKATKVKAALIAKTFESYTKPLVVLANEKTVINDRYAPKDIKNKVIRADSLVKTIKDICAASNQPKCNLKEMEEQARVVLSFHSENNTDYIERFREAVNEQLANKAEKPEAKEEPKKITVNTGKKRICPRCGEGELVERDGKKGRFIACNRFPKCWYTEDIEKRE